MVGYMLFRFQSNIYFYRQPKLVAFAVLTVLTVYSIFIIICGEFSQVIYLSSFKTIFFLRRRSINFHESFEDDVALSAVKASLCQFLWALPPVK